MLRFPRPLVWSSLLVLLAPSLWAQAPQITHRPLSRALLEGDSTSLNVVATGAQPLTYTWQRQGTRLAETTGTLRLDDLTVTDRGWYHVTVSNAEGSATSVVNLHVSPRNTTFFGWGAPLPGDVGPLMAISSPTYYTYVLGLTQLGTVVGWGVNNSGIRDIPSDLTGVVQISAGTNSLALTAVGSVTQWGHVSNYPAVFPPASLGDVVAVSAGAKQNLALRADGTVVAWATEQGIAPWVPNDLRDVVAIAAGDTHSMALRSDGTIRVWHYTGSDASDTPPGLSDVVSIAIGANIKVAIHRDGTVSAWGGSISDDLEVPLDLTNAISAIANNTPPLVLRADGTATYLKGGPFAPKVPDDLTGAFDLANVGRQYGSWLAALVRTRAPSIESQPANADLTARETLTLRAEIAGSPPLTYRWSFNGNPLADGDTVEGTTTEELRIVDADQTRTGSYTLEVTNAQGSITTEPAIVTIHQPPVLSRRPLTQLRALGDTATFSVEASDPAPLTYTWKHNGEIIPGASSATLNLPALQLEDQGFYEVIVSNPSASISSVFHLRLSPPSSTERVLTAWGWTSETTAPAQPLNDVVKLQLDSSFAFCLHADGTLSSWNLYYGDVTTYPELSNVVDFAARFGNAVALTAEGRVHKYGYNSNGDWSEVTELRHVAALFNNDTHLMAVRTDGSAWSSYLDGLENLTDVIQVVPGQFSTRDIFALHRDGSVELIAGTSTSGSQPKIPFPTDLSEVVALSGDKDHTLALRRDGSVIGWGFNDYGQAQVPRLPLPVVAIDVRNKRSHAVAIDGTLFSWGQPFSASANSAIARSGIQIFDESGSYAAAVVAAEAPRIGDPASSRTINAGKFFHLDPNVSASLPTDFQWLKDGTEITGATSPTLEISALSAGDSGNYTLVATNEFGTTTSPVYTINVVEPVDIESRPLSRMIAEGGGTTFSVVASGHGELAYQWSHDSQLLPGETGSSLSLDNCNRASRGRYSVLITDEVGGQAFSVAYLEVAPSVGGLVGWGNQPAQFPLAPHNFVTVDVSGNQGAALRADGTIVTWGDSSNLATPIDSVVAIARGGNQTLGLRADGSVVGTQTWDSTRVPDELGNVVAISSESGNHLALLADGTVRRWGYSNSSLTVPADLSDVVAIAAGTSHAVALRRDGSVVTWGAALRNPPDQVVRIAAGGDKTLFERADGSVALWTSDFVSSFDSVGPTAMSVGTDLALVVAGNGRLQASAPSLVEPSLFTAEGILDVATGTDFHAAILSYAPSAPGITAQPVAQAVPFDDTVTFAVTATGSPLLRYRWMKNGTALDVTTPNLVLERIQESDAGLYSVEISSPFGRVTSQSVALTVQVLQVETATVAIAGRSITLSVNAPSATAYQWRHRGAEIAGATGATFTLDQLSRAQNGDYDVVLTTPTGTRVAHSYRLDVRPDVTLDTLVGDMSFAPVFEKADAGTIHAVVRLADGSYLVGGDFTRIGDHPRQYLARFLSNGSLDERDLSPVLDGPVYAMDTDTLGRIYVGGDFLTADNQPAGRLFRLTSALDIDPGFSVGDGFSHPVHALRVDVNDKILVGGDFDYFNATQVRRLVRLETDGSRDSSYSSAYNTSSNRVREITLLPDGRIMVVGGTSGGYVSRQNSDGTVDPSWAYPGVVSLNETIHHLHPMADGSWMISGGASNAGSGTALLGSLSSTGVWEGRDSYNRYLASFRGGLSISVALNDGRFLVAGPETPLSLLKADRSLDTTLPPLPWSHGRVDHISQESDGAWRIWALATPVGPSAPRLGSTRLAADLSAFSAFTGFPVRSAATVFHATQQTADRVLVRGDFTHINNVPRSGLARLNGDGSVDPTFRVTVPLGLFDSGPLVIDGRQRILVHDGSRLRRLHPDGTLDPSFQTPRTHPGALTLAPDGRVILSNRGYEGENGYFASTAVVRRLLENGTIDDAFAPRVSAEVLQTLPQSSGHIVLNGSIDAIDGQRTNTGPKRIRADGSWDPSFALPNYSNATLVSTAEDRLYMVVNPFPYSAATPLRAFLPSGTPDSEFSYDATYPVVSILPLPDGSLLRGGPFRWPARAVPYGVIARHLADGTLDENLIVEPGTTLQGYVRQLVLLDDHSLWLLGDRLSMNGQSRSGIMRLLPFLELGLVSPPTNVPVELGGTAVFSAEAGGVGSISYQWYRDGVAVAGATNPTFAVSDVSFADVVPYHVVVTNGTKTVTSDPVTVVGPRPAPVIIRQPVSVITTAGHPATVSVEAAASGEITYQWRRSGYAIPGGNAATFTIPDTTRADAGIYDVLIRDGLAVSVSDGVRIDVAPRSYPTTTEVDPTFATRFETDGGTINAILPTTDGKFIVSGDFTSIGGTPAAGIVRVNAAFEVDPGFAPPALTGKVTATDSGYATAIKAMAVLPGGRILVTQPLPRSDDNVAFRNVLVRLRNDGTLDPNFTSTAFQHNASSIAVQSDGRVVVIGHYLQSAEDETPLRLYRLNQDGSLDTSFQPPTFTYYDSPATPNAVALQSTGKIVVAGNFHAIAGSTSVGLARLNSDGSIDPNFAPTGFTVPSARQVVVDRHDNLWLAGQVRVGNLNRWFAVFDQDGNLRTETGPFSSWSNAVLQVAADQTLWAANYRSPPGEVRLWRQTGDFTFAQVGQTIPFATNTFNFTAFAFSVAPDGSMMVTHRDSVESATVVRQVSAAQPTGELLASTRREAGVAAATHGPGGTVYVTGEFTHLNGLAIGHLARLRADGSVDSSFHTGTGFDRTPATVVKAPDGGVYVLGDFSTYNGQAVPRLVHLLPNGTLDSTFVVTATEEQLAVDHPLTVLRDGRLLLSGNVCFLPSGEIDPTFHNYLATTNRSVALTNGGAILVHRIDGNYFTWPIDSAGNPDSGLPTQLKSYSMALLPDEGLFVGGYQTAAIGRSDFPAVKRMLPPDLRTVDPTFEFAGPPEPVKSVSSYRGPELLAQEDGRVILFENRGMWRFNTDGSLDQSFSVPGVSDLSSTPRAPNPPGATAADVLLLDDGRLLIADDGMNVGGYRRRGLVVLRSTDRVIITEQPADHSTYTGDSLVLTAETSATAGLAYQWFKDGQAIAGETSATLERTALQPNDAGRYHVVITSPTGASVTSATARVIVATPIAPTFTIQPRSHSAASGDSLTLRALATGDPAPSYQWRRNGQDIADAHHSTLILSNVTAEDVGTYSVVATNRAGSTGSSEVTVSVYPAGTHARQQLTEIQRSENAVIVKITNSFSSEMAVTSLDWEVLLPPGWTYTVSTGTDAATAAPSPNDSELLIWSWKSGDLSELNFTYTITKPLAAFEPGPPDQLVTLLTVETADGSTQYLVQPDPLLLRLQHSADVDGDNRLSLSELLRVIELYNTRAGTSRTGRYRMQSGTADGFAPETTNGSPLPTRFHSADFDRDGQLSLSELLRVIELYNTRTGTSRTGRYRFATDSTDGFSPDP